MSENAASEEIAAKHGDGDENIARHLRTRLKALREQVQAPVAPPAAGSLGLLKFLEGRVQDYRMESLRSGAWDDHSKLYVKGLRLRHILRSRLSHLDGQDRSVAVQEARSLLSNLPLFDPLVIPEALPAFERKQLIDLLDDIQRILDRLHRPDVSGDGED